MLRAPLRPHQGSKESHFPEVAWEEPKGRFSGGPALWGLVLQSLVLRGYGLDASGRTGLGMGGMAGRDLKIHPPRGWRAMWDLGAMWGW